MTKAVTQEDVSGTSFGKLLLGFVLVVVAYLAGLAAAWGILLLFPSMHPLWSTLVADIGATIVVFIFSVIFNNVSFYDPYWSIQPIAIAIYWMVLGFSSANSVRQIVVLSVVAFWGVRLTLNWIRGWNGLKHEDWRYVKYRKEHPKLFWFIAFTGLEMMPTLIVYLGCLAIYPAMISGAQFTFLDGIGIAIAVGATLIEFIADEQMKIFCKMNDNPNRVMDLGLWSTSRHPNYFGEVSFWWGIFFFGLSAIIYDPTYQLWWIAIILTGPVAMVVLFIVISIPLLENKQKAKRPEYEEYMKRVSSFIPWFPRNG